MDESKTPYGSRVTTNLPFEEALARTTELLKEEGFGVLTRIDVQQTLKEKLGVEFRRYLILGACNPVLAHRALQSELDIGLLLPCNVTLYETESGTVVGFLDPAALMAVTGNEALRAVAAEAGARLARVRGRLGV
jgi:uncharacterized protein (DUF302 family)